MMKKKLFAGLMVAIVAVVGVAVMLDAEVITASNTGEEVVTIVAREVPVEAGDITIGLTEAGTIGIPTHDVRYDYALTVDEVFVREGDFVNEGDVLFKVSLESIESQIDTLDTQIENYQSQIDDIYKQIESLESDYLSYEKEYQTALSTYDLDLVKAELEYEQTVALTESSEITYNLSVASLEPPCFTEKDN